MKPCRIIYAESADYSAKNLVPALEKVLAAQLEQNSVVGKSVLLKPNLLAWRRKEDIACVHPRFIVETARLFLDAGAARVAVMENPAVQPAPMILSAMGIADELKKMNVAAANFARYRKIPMPENVRFHHLELADEFLDFDYVADLAKVKTHAMMTLTLCVKNLFGLVSGSGRIGWHLAVGRDFEQFADMLLDIYLAVKPRFNLLDGIICMEGNGPGSGTPAHRGFIAGGIDSLAVDHAVSQRLGVPDLLLIRRAKERRILTEFQEEGSLKNFLPLVLPDPPGSSLEWGVTLPKFCRDFLRNHALSKPHLDRTKCIGCGLCMKMCPPKSLKPDSAGKPLFNELECIRCCCCQEHCPKGAITFRKSYSMQVIEGIEKFMGRCFRRNR